MYLAVKWGIDERTGAPLLLAAGLEGVCRVLDCNTQKLLWASPCLYSLFLRAFVGATVSGPLHEPHTLFFCEVLPPTQSEDKEIPTTGLLAPCLILLPPAADGSGAWERHKRHLSAAIPSRPLLDCQQGEDIHTSKQAMIHYTPLEDREVWWRVKIDRQISLIQMPTRPN